LFFASWLIKITWLKLAGGAYLLYLFFTFFYEKILRNMKLNPAKSGATALSPGSTISGARF